MDLSMELVSQFAKAAKADPPKTGENVLYGTIVTYEGSQYVRLDGSERLTPVTTAVMSKDGDRVLVSIQDHSATVTANVSAPATSESYVKDEIGNVITEVEILIADKVDTIELDAERARIDELEAKNVTITGELDAAKANIEDLKAQNVTIEGSLDAVNASIENLETKKLDAEIADITYATIENLEATNATINNLKADYGDFKDLTTEKLEAVDAEIKNLDAEKISAEEADLKYANIDFANIGMAAVEQLFAKSGIIGDLVVGDQNITGKLVGVTIIGDLIEGGTVKADKLVIKGEDGLYYKLNTNGETVSSEQTDYNSINGSILTAKSVTAEKVNVNDLVAFGATIGGFHIKADAIYSGVKESVDNTTRGLYLDDSGQISIGDSKSFLKYYKSSDGTYKLEVSAGSIKFGANSESVEEVIDGVKETTIRSSVEQFYSSTSPTELSGGSWANSQPIWTEGKYIWRRTLVTYGDGRTEYTPSQNGVCITGNTGAKGSPGTTGATGTGVASITEEYYLSTSKTTQTGGSWTTTPPTWSSGKYVWTRSKIVYKNPASTVYTTPVCDSSWEAVNEIEIGGRNLIPYSNIKSYRNQPFKYDLETGIISATNFVWFFEVLVRMEPESTYTLTIDSVTNTEETTFNNRILARLYRVIDGVTLYDTAIGYYTDSKKAITFTSPKAVPDGYVRLMLYTKFGNVPSDVTIRKIKLEAGNKPTDWTPAPEDTQKDIEELQGATTAQGEKIETQERRLSDLEVNTSEISATVQRVETETKTSIDGVKSTVSELSERVNLSLTSDQVQIAIEKTLSEGVDTVRTKTGFTFDDEGMTISKSGSPMTTQATEEGFYVREYGENVLVANSAGVEARNLNASTFLTIGNRIRFEKYGEDRIGCFWIGG